MLKYPTNASLSVSVSNSMASPKPNVPKSAVISRQGTMTGSSSKLTHDAMSSITNQIMKTKSLLNFESKLDKDLADTT